MDAYTPASDGESDGASVTSVEGSRDPVRLWLLMTVTAAIGLAAAVVLLVEKIELIADPSYVPTCSIDPILSCGSVMQTPQAEAFGIPNPILGIIGFAVVLTVGAGLAAGARFRVWFWLGLEAGVSFGILFVHWLIYQSLYVIGALCPYCMIVWTVMIPLFWYVTLHNLNRIAGESAAPWPWVQTLTSNHGIILTTWYLAIVGLIVVRFWDHWVSLLA